MSKKIDFVNSLRDLNESDLKARIQEDELRLKKLEFAHAISPLENPMSIRSLRKDIARLQTKLNLERIVGVARLCGDEFTGPLEIVVQVVERRDVHVARIG